MNRLIPLLLLALSACSGCGRIDSGVSSKLDPASPFFTEISYFVEQGRARGAETERLVAGVGFEFEDLDGAEARCVKTPFFGRTVKVDPDVWGNFNESSRRSLIAHELGHCVLNQDHREGKTIMLTNAPTGYAFTNYESALLDELFSVGFQ